MNLKSSVCLIASCLAVSGCGGGGAGDLPDLGRVSGTVTIDGEPTPDVSVMFSPIQGGRASSGVTDSNGNYVLHFNATTEGAVVGSHNVHISSHVDFDPNDPNAPMMPPEGNVPSDYKNIEKQAEVKAGENDIDLSYP
jgi:hypothetical protein